VLVEHATKIQKSAMKSVFRGFVAVFAVFCAVFQTLTAHAHVPAASASKCHLSATSTTIAPTPGKCTILIIGDSLGNNLGSGTIYQLDGTLGIKLVNLSRGSTGLSNSWFYNWPEKLPGMLAHHKPDLVVVFFGANDHQDMRSHGKNLHFGSKAWTAAYSGEVKKIVSESTSAGAQVAWFGMPSMRSIAFSNYMKTLNTTVQTVVPAAKNSTYIPTWEYLSTSKGKFLEYGSVNGSRLRLRGEDGIHFSTVGQQVLGSFAVTKIAETYHVKLTPKHLKRLTK